MNQFSQKKHKPSFTLIEVLIAVTISTVILLGIYSALNTGILSHRKIDSTLDIQQEARITLGRMEKDLKNAFAYKEKDSAFKGDNKSLDFFTVSEVYEKTNLRTEVCRTKYLFDAGTITRVNCVGIAAISENAGCQSQAMADGIKDIDFQYAAISANNPKTITWQAAWPQDNTQSWQMPKAVKVKLTLVDKSSKKESLLNFSKIIPITQEAIKGAEESAETKNN